MEFVLFFMISFFCGSCMFSYWIGLLLKKNIREVGDGNPGGANLIQAAGVKWGLLGIFLDFMKGFIPTWFLMSKRSMEPALIPVLLAPILGHAFSPFLRFSGGKTLAVTFGVWSALTDFKIGFVYAIILFFLLVAFLIMKKGKAPTSVEDSIQTTTGFLLVGLYLFLNNYSMDYLIFWLCNFLIIFYRQAKNLQEFWRQHWNKERDREFPV